jgi:nucleoside-diphosphate-sugar epimerase
LTTQNQAKLHAWVRFIPAGDGFGVPVFVGLGNEILIPETDERLIITGFHPFYNEHDHVLDRDLPHKFWAKVYSVGDAVPIPYSVGGKIAVTEGRVSPSAFLKVAQEDRSNLTIQAILRILNAAQMAPQSTRKRTVSRNLNTRPVKAVIASPVADVRPGRRSQSEATVRGDGTYIVTGAGGFIGRRLVDRLRAAGHRVHALSLSDGFDIRTDELPTDSVDHVFHLAARIGVAESWQDPHSFFEVNALGTFRILDQCRRRGFSLCYVSSFIHSSEDSGATTESGAIKLDNPYTFSKYVGEQTCGFFDSHYGVRTVILRPSNIYGPGQGRGFLIPHVVAQVIDDQSTEVLVQDLSPRRDYVHVDDVVDAMLLSVTAPAGSIFNLGSGTAYSVEEIIRCTCRLAGRQKPYRVIGKSREHETAVLHIDATAARQVLGWQPKVSLERGIQSVLESMQ